MTDIESLVYTYPDIDDPEFQKLLSMKEEFWPEHIMSARDRIRQFVRRFMVQYDRLFLFYSTGAGKTCMSSGAAEPLVRGIVKELYETYLVPVRTNINKIIVILTSEHSRDDFMQKVIENCHPHLYEKIRRETSGSDMITKLAAYTKELGKYYSFETKQTFLTSIYGQNASPDKIEAPEALINYYHNKFIIIDEIHTFSREDVSDQAEEDLIYARYHNILHRLMGSKIMIMSATPMKDKPNEIIKIMNLILPLDKQMTETVDVFDRQEMSKHIGGYISYYQMSGIRTIERGVMFQIGNDPGEFTTVFPVKMSSFQSETYRKVIQEKDFFNRNALKVGNIVHPQGISHSDFLNNYTESSRGGYEATVEFKRYLKVRENREKLSPKFCSVIDIARNSPGVVFCYMRSLEFGIYDLATFFELEGFERYNPRLDHPVVKKGEDGTTNIVLVEKKPRFAVLIGETKRVRGKLESMLTLSNLPENVDGEYIKVIIGSSAVKEAYDIFNCITTIVVSPEQTETSMIQAIGRTTRSGGLDVLLTKYPQMKAIVNIYKMASYVDESGNSDNPYSLSKDIDTYVESARKDRNIKRVERILRENAVDCLIHHDLNFNKKNIDGSYACLYGECDYTCVIPPPSGNDEDEVLETSSMDVLYQGDKIAMIIRKVRDIFREKFYISIDELSTLADSQSLALRAVEEMSVQKMQIINRFGQSCYVYFDKRGAYISPSSIIGSTMTEIHPVEYSHYVTSVNITPLNDLVDQPVRIPDMIERIMTTNEPVTGSLENDQILLDRFKFFIRREIVSKAEVLEHVRVKGEDKQKRKDITGTSVYWINYSGKLLTHGEIKTYEGDKGIIRLPSGMSLPTTTIREDDSSEEIPPSSWVYPDRYLGKVLSRIYRKIMIDKFLPYEKKYKYFGVTIPMEPDVLRIAESDKDNAKNPGKVCSSWKREELIGIADYIGIGNIQDKSKFVKDWCKVLMEEFKKKDMLVVL